MSTPASTWCWTRSLTAAPMTRSYSCGIDLLALVLGEDHVDDVLRARQAAHVRRQDATVLSHVGPPYTTVVQGNLTCGIVPGMIVRWGLESLEEVLAELSVSAPLLITEELWQETELPVAQRFHGARPHAEITGVREAAELAKDADGLVALGGGSVMDTTKAVSVQTGLPMVSIPTTYAGAEWTPFFGVRNEQTRTKDAGFDARVEGIVYEPKLTLRMPAAGHRGHRAQRADALRRGALRPRSHRRERRARAAGRRPHRAPPAGRARRPRGPRRAHRPARGRDARRRRAARRHGPRARDGAVARRALRRARTAR